MEKTIEVIDLKKYYYRGQETVKALDGVDLSVYKGEIVSIVGPSGSGKTTLLNLISCLDEPTQGIIKIGGNDLTEFKESQLINIRRQNLGFIFQHFYLMPTLTVKENIELPLIFAKKTISQDKLKFLLKVVGLEKKEYFYARTLNGGDKQRVAIVRALVNDPKILIADEPTGNLESDVRDSIMELFMELANSGLSIIVATHDLELASKAKRVIYLQDGKIIPEKESSLYWQEK